MSGNRVWSASMMIRVLAPVLLGFFLSACAGPPASPSGGVPVARGIVLDLPDPAELGRAVEAVQMVTARRRGETHVFEARLSVDGGRLLMVGTDSLGRRAMTIAWAGGRMAAERAAWLPEALAPENVLADIVLMYWPEAALRRALPADVALEERDGRRSIGGGAVIVTWRGDPWNGRTRLVNASWGYELDVASVVVGP